MFVESLVESTPLLRSRNRLPAMVSVAVQCALVAVLIAIPILHPEVLHPGPLKLSVIAPPRVPAPPPPMQRPHVLPAVAASAPSEPSAPSPVLTTAHGFIRSTAPAVEAPALAFGTPMGTGSSALPVGPAGDAPTVVVKPAARPGPLRISNGVTAGLLLAPIQPLYPAIARATGIQGTVVVEAVISKSGRIESAHAVSGPLVLQAAALEAVRNARYHPYLLNGEPTEVETTISINFRMN